MNYLHFMLRNISRPLLALASQSYITGPHLSDAVFACHRFMKMGIASTVGYFNTNDESPESVSATYISAINTLASEKLDTYVSIKAPAIQYNNALLRDIINQGNSAGIGIHFDSHGPLTADKTFESINSAAQCYSQLGCTLPSRWQRSLADADAAVELGLRVRVVKGQWYDATSPPTDLRKSYLALVDRLAGRARSVAIATHDPVLAQESIRRLHLAGTPCELELLLGLPMQALIPIAHESGVTVRVYIPFGVAWLPYALSGIRRNPRIAWWILRDAIRRRGY